jgi:glycerol-3-phosphate acyltransferase PlsY
VGLLACATWLAVAFLFRYSSLAALLAFASAPVYGWLLADRQLTRFSIAVAALVWLRHHENIRRLLAGTEAKLGGGRKRS